MRPTDGVASAVVEDGTGDRDEWFVDAGFDEVFVSRPGLRFGVGARAETPPLPTAVRAASTFVGH